jgi:hypothetical protein
MENVFEPMENFAGNKSSEQKSDDLSSILQKLKKVEDIAKVKTAVETGGLGAGTVLAKRFLEIQNQKSSFNDFENFEGDDFSNFGLKEWFKSKFSTQSTPNESEKKILGMSKKTAINVGATLVILGIATYFLMIKKIKK